MRTRKEIEEIEAEVKPLRAPNATAAIQRELILEVLLDIRALLATLQDKGEIK